MDPLILHLPSALREAVAAEASKSGMSEPAWLEQAAREKLTAIAESAWFKSRAVRGNREKYDAILAQAADGPVVSGDER